jgi:hypothetical protein
MEVAVVLHLEAESVQHVMDGGVGMGTNYVLQDR